MLTFFQADASPISVNFSSNYSSLGSTSSSIEGLKPLMSVGNSDRNNLPNWAIPADLLSVNTRQVTDDPDTHDTSLTTALERNVSKSWVPQTRSTAIAFYSESGEFFQLRYLEGSPDGRRYDAVAKSGLKYFYPTVPSDYRERINAELSVTLSLSGSFWEQVRHFPEVSIFDCEGAPKALALVGIGYAAISGFGAFGGVEKNEYQTFKRPIGKRKSGKMGGYTVEKVALPQARLSKGLSDLANKGRRITLVPDMDTNPATRRSVANAFLHRARLLEKRGVNVRIAFWDSSLGKGIDDVLAAHGETVVKQILDNPLTPAEFTLKIELSFELAKPSAIVHTRNLQDDAPDLPKTGLVFTDSGTGTGKTKLAARETEGRTLLAPYPLRSLAKAAAIGLDANYRNDGKLDRNQGAYFDGDVLSDRLTIVYDSLSKVNLNNQFAGELNDLVLDEISHGLRHALTGATCRKERLQIIEKFIEAIRKSDRVIALDADLTRVELEILRELRPGETEFYLKNTRKPDPYVTHWLTLPSKQPTVAKAIEATLELIAQKFAATGLIHWACDALKTSEEIAHAIGFEKCAVVNSDCIRDKGPKTMLAIAGKFDELEAMGVRYIITSPSVIQGLNWEEMGRFSGVVGTFSGCSITPRQMRQALARVRETVDRIVWASPHRRVPGKWGNESNPRMIKNRLLERDQFNRSSIGADLDLSESQAYASDFAARLIAADNLWRATPAASLKTLLEDHGHTIAPVCVDSSGESFAAAAADWQEKQDRALFDAQILNDIEAQSLKVKSESDRLSPEERRSLSRWELCHFYSIDDSALTLSLIERDRDGLRGKVREFEKLFSPDGEELALAAVRDRAGGSAVDADRSLAARRVRMEIGLPKMVALLQERSLSKDAPEMIAFADRCARMSSAVKNGLNYTVRDGVSGINIVADLLAQMGQALVCTRTRIDGKATRIYRLDSEKWADLSLIAEIRFLKGIGRIEQSDPPPSVKTIQREVDQCKKTPKLEEEEELEDIEPSDLKEEEEFSFEFKWEEEPITAMTPIATLKISPTPERITKILAHAVVDGADAVVIYLPQTSEDEICFLYVLVPESLPQPDALERLPLPPLPFLSTPVSTSTTALNSLSLNPS
jgi:hypothetical protein